MPSPIEDQLAAIDVGSNGIRIVIGRYEGDGQLTELYARREAVRLGADSFGGGKISDATIEAAIKAFRGFRKLLDEYRVEHFRAVATSATREAKNRKELIAAIRAETGIEVEVIGGLEEAQIIFEAIKSQVPAIRDNVALLIDMGGGSVEVTIAREGNPLAWETLPLGPVRLLRQLNGQAPNERATTRLLKKHRGSVEQLIHTELGDATPALCVGTGGNIVRMAKFRKQLLDRDDTSYFKRKDLERMVDRVLAMSVKERIDKLGLRTDRADVIGIAMIVMQMVLEEASIKKVVVPRIGLKEGLLLQVAYHYHHRVKSMSVYHEPE